MNHLALTTLNQMTATGCMGDGTGLIILAEAGIAALLALAAALVGIVALDDESKPIGTRGAIWLVGFPLALGLAGADIVLAFALAERLTLLGPVVAAIPSIVVLDWARRRGKKQRQAQTQPRPHRHQVLPEHTPILRAPRE